MRSFVCLLTCRQFILYLRWLLFFFHSFCICCLIVCFSCPHNTCHNRFVSLNLCIYRIETAVYFFVSLWTTPSSSSFEERKEKNEYIEEENTSRKYDRDKVNGKKMCTTVWETWLSKGDRSSEKDICFYLPTFRSVFTFHANHSDLSHIELILRSTAQIWSGH